MTNRTEWDAVVIGAGLAGLSCAAHLAKAGKQVVVVEQHSRPGGLWTSFSRKGLIFDCSTHWVTEPQTLNRTLEDLGSQPVEFVQLNNLGRYVGPPRSAVSAGPAAPSGPGAPAASASWAAGAALSWDIVLGPDAEAFKQSVRASFPTVNDGALTKLVNTALNLSRLLDSMPVYSPELASPWSRVRAGLRTAPQLLRILRFSRMPAEEYFARLFPGDDLAGLRAALYTLAPIPDMPAIGQLAILGIGLRGRIYAPRGGSQVLADAFAEAALRNGVELRYSQEAISILTTGRQVRGISLSDGTELHAPVVVSAADAKRTFYHLLGRHRVPESYQRRLEAQPVSEPYALLSIATTLEPAALGFDGTDVFVCPSADVPRALESKEPDDCFFLLVFPQYVEPGVDPALRAIQVVVPAAYAWREHWETWPTPERGRAYRDLKKEWSERIVRRVKEYVPRLDTHLAAVDVATPITFHRYTMNTEGAPVGWHYGSRRRWKQRVPFLRGLYQAGHWVGPSGAVPVTRSGQWAAELILRDTAKGA
jgi:phytoene dehydrogenase-like protein